MARQSCEDCGSAVYDGHCANCHEETYIAEQNYSNDDPIAFSPEFNAKLDEQSVEAQRIMEARYFNIKKLKIHDTR